MVDVFLFRHSSQKPRLGLLLLPMNFDLLGLAKDFSSSVLELETLRDFSQPLETSIPTNVNW